MDHLFQKFFDIYTRFIPKEYKEFFSKEDLERFVKDQFEFILIKEQEIHINCHNTENKWPYHLSVIQINLIDMPFIVDTVLDYLKSEKYRINRLINAILYTKREQHKLLDISDKEKEENNYQKESFVYVEIEKLPKEQLESIKNKIFHNLKELELIVKDFPKTNQILKNLNFNDEELNHTKNWILENFVQMGLLVYSKNKIIQQLGILRQEENKKIVLQEIETLSKPKGENIVFIESSIKSNVKRYKPLHIIIFFHNDELYLLLGSFAGKGELTPRFLIPPIRKKLDYIAKLLNAPINGFRYKEIYKISQLIPLGILFSRDLIILKEWLDFFINNLYASEQKIFIIEDKSYQGVWVLIVELQKYADTNEHLIKNLKDYQIFVDTYFKRTYNQFLYTFLFLKSSNQTLKQLKEFLTQKSEEIFYSWYDQFLKHITYVESSTEKIRYKLEYYKELLPPTLPNYVTPKEAYNNITFIESITPEKKFYVKFAKSLSINEKKEVSTLNVYSCDVFSLTEIFPILDSVGLKIITDVSFEFFIKEGTRYLNIFYIENNFNSDWLSKIEQGIEELLNQKHTIEPINQLLIKTSLSIREISFIKTLIAYYYQLHKQYSRIFLNNFFINNPDFSQKLIHYIKEAFLLNKTEFINKLKQYIYNFKTISEQTVVSNFIELIENIVRTNFFLNYEEIAIKVKSKNISYINEPKPLYEIFVYSKDLEGIHIRSDYIARGGIRWSDRIDDYRIEIYDLMKTQMIKNTIIVPNGAKGGFIIKKNLLNLDKKQKNQIAEHFYKRFIENLLSLTDNLNKEDDTKIIRLDDHDPYLVVAADKGTATFSDIANSIAVGRGFWLKDAFASGGSNGYDHKKQGITAKGAWESVKKHFSELQIDPEKDVITVIGIGDMSGDVFGNGMILSKTIKLIAAFNHIHIFIDPNPDPEISYRERLRLFKEVKGWDQYNPELISSGGGVFERNAARIQLSKEIKERLNISVSSVSGEELIRYILKAKVDLLWNGGIGTYIKSSQESHKDVMDPSNDNVRIDANELNVRVIAEGGNLGLTTKARIEAAQKGILLNTDFIDNSGGVDMSDHEVNLKIFLNYLEDKNLITHQQRNHLIKKYDKIMIEKVLYNNRFNNLAIALEKYRLSNNRFLISDWLKYLVENHVQPEKEIALFKEITQPEICYILGYTKLYFKNYFGKISINFNKDIDLSVFRFYFPTEIVDRFQDLILNHPLKDRMIKTILLNDMINTLGTLHFFLFSKVLNKPYETLLTEYVHFKHFTSFDILEIYSKYFDVPKPFLYEQLIEYSRTTSIIHVLMKNYDQFSQENKNIFIKNIHKLTKHLIKHNNLKIPTGHELISKKMKELNAFVQSYEIVLIHFFVNQDDIILFYEFLQKNHLLLLYYRIKNLNINNLQELKFQFRLFNMYFNILKKLTGKESLDLSYLENKDFALIDLFEILMDLEEKI